MRKFNKTSLEIHPLKGLKMETSNGRILTYLIGGSILIFSVCFGAAQLIKSIAPNGLI